MPSTFTEPLDDDVLGLSDGFVVEATNYKPIYGSVEGANRYFSEQLYGQLWEIQTADVWQKALITATRNIDSLRFAGRKTVAGQPLEYPRNGETEVPQAIQYATYEEALALLKGIEPDTEAANLFVTSRVFGLRVRTDYDVAHSPEHVVAGVASFRAWNLLKPYLNTAREVKIHRVS